MKQFLWILTILFVGTSCYSYEFIPAPNYPNYRKSTVETVEITFHRPEREFVALGTLTIRDFAGNVRDSGFLRSIKREAAKRGAEGAWIQKQAIKETILLQAVPTNPVQSYGERHYQKGGNLQGKLKIITVKLFNYTGEKSQ